MPRYDAGSREAGLFGVITSNVRTRVGLAGSCAAKLRPRSRCTTRDTPETPLKLEPTRTWGGSHRRRPKLGTSGGVAKRAISREHRTLDTAGDPIALARSNVTAIRRGIVGSRSAASHFLSAIGSMLLGH